MNRRFADRLMPRKYLAFVTAWLVGSLAGTVFATTMATFGSGANQFTMEFVTVGNPNNAADPTSDGTHNPAGNVPYVYNMGVYEVSRDMVSKANAEANLGVTLDAMGFVIGGPRPNMPATGVSWNEAARFVNWLNTSQGFSPAYKFSTQPGDAGYAVNQNISLWVAGDLGFNASNPFRNSLAHYFLPTVDEWYKAAYYDPNANGGAGGYWNFPNGSDSAPTPVPGGTVSDTVVYLQSLAQGPADFNNAGGLSPYGVMALGGNVDEWEETELDVVNDSGSSDRGVRGGTWYDGSFVMSSLHRSQGTPTVEFNYLGFRVASVPEPSSAALLGLGIAGLLVVGRRLGCHSRARLALSRK